MKPIFRICILAALAACSSLPEPKALTEKDIEEVRAMLARDLHARGSAGMDRVKPDAVQQACNLHAGAVPTDQAARLEAAELAKIPFPSGSLIGDWKRGERIAQNGRGLQWTDKAGDAGGGSCYNCHQLSPHEASHGTLGPSLLGFGKLRGNSPEMQRYAYGRIFNSKAYSVCSQMPRLGASGTLTEQQIKDLVALLLDPESPVNKP